MGLESVAIALITASGVAQAFGARQTGKAQQAASNYNAAVARQEGEIAQREAQIESTRIRREQRIFRARQEALFAKSGVQLAGSPLEVITDSAAEFEFDLLVNDYNAQIKRTRAESQARLDEFTGRTLYREGLVKAGTTLLTTGANIAMNLPRSGVPRKTDAPNP